MCSNYGNWMWTAGVGGDPRGAYRKFNMIKQGIDYDPQVIIYVLVHHTLISPNLEYY